MAEANLLVAWLKDAYGMEIALIPVLENHAKAAKDYPQVQARIQQHAEETRRHAEMVEQVLRRWNEAPSAVKTVVGGVTGAVQSVMTAPFQDDLVKNALSDFAAENFEIACYSALMVAAESLGDTETVEVCEMIMEDEEEMAAWLEANLPLTVQEALAMKSAEVA